MERKDGYAAIASGKIGEETIIYCHEAVRLMEVPPNADVCKLNAHFLIAIGLQNVNRG